MKIMRFSTKAAVCFCAITWMLLDYFETTGIISNFFQSDDGRILKQRPFVSKTNVKTFPSWSLVCFFFFIFYPSFTTFGIQIQSLLFERFIFVSWGHCLGSIITSLRLFFVKQPKGIKGNNALQCSHALFNVNTDRQTYNKLLTTSESVPQVVCIRSIAKTDP